MPNFTIPLYINRRGQILKVKNFPEAYSEANRIILKRGDSFTFAIQFLDDNSAPYLLASGSRVRVGTKALTKFDTPALVLGGFTSTDPATSADPYLVPFLIEGDALDAALGVNGDDSDDIAFIDLMFEVTWSENGGATWNSSTDPVQCRIHNDVIRDEDASGDGYVSSAYVLTPMELGSEPVDGVLASATFNINAQPGIGNTVAIGDPATGVVTYTFVDAVTALYQVLRGADGNDAATNLIDEINGIGGSPAHPTVTAVNGLTLKAINDGVAGNGIGFEFSNNTDFVATVFGYRACTVSGTLAPDATGELVYAGETGGRPQFSTNGATSPQADGVEFIRVYYSGGRWLLRHYPTGAIGDSNRWRAATGTEATPDLAGGWAQDPSSSNTVTGTPIFTMHKSLTGGDGTIGYLGQHAYFRAGLGLVSADNDRIFECIGVLPTIWSELPKTTSGLTTEPSNGDAPAGKLGEYFESVRNGAFALSLTTTVGVNIAQVSLTAGDWDIQGIGTFFGTSGSPNCTSRVVSISIVSGTITNDGLDNLSAFAMTGSFYLGLPATRRRIKLSGPATVYLVGSATFTGGGVSAMGGMTARRAR